jgi:hypothetical protein
MQYPFNWLALGIVRDALRESCVVHIEDKVLPEVSSVDAWVEPRVGRMARDDDDWLTRMGYEPSEIEPFHLGPTLGEHNDSIMKVMALHARERKRAKDEKRPQPPTPLLWFACAQHPLELIARWAMAPMTARGWPTGFYESASPAGPRAVSLRELPRDQRTLLLRLMASGETLKQAVEDLDALPRRARERLIAGPILVQLQGDLSRMGVTVTWSTPEEYTAMMSHEEAVRIFEEREARAIAVEQALAVSQRALTESLRSIQRLFERRLGRSLSDDEREAVTVRIHAPGPERLTDVALDLDAPALAAWLADPAAR